MSYINFSGKEVIEALQRLEWRLETLEMEFQDVKSLEEPDLGIDKRARRFERRDQLYEAERKLHNYLSGYYSYWRLVMSVGHATGDDECAGRIRSVRNEHDEKDCARIVRGLRMYVQKENVLPLLVYISAHDSSTPKYALNKDELFREDFYEPNFEHYYGSVDGKLIFPFEIIKENMEAVRDLHEDVNSLVETYGDDEIEEYKEQIRELRKIEEEHVLPELPRGAEKILKELLD